MISDQSSSVGRRGHPVLLGLAAFPVSCLTCALLTDAAYVRTMNVMWADFSAWLLAAGAAGGVLAALAGLVSLVVHRRDRGRRSAWPVVFGSFVTLIVVVLNNLVHSRDAWTSVMPAGIALSAVTVLLMLATGWLAFGAEHRVALAAPYAGVRE